MSPSYTLSNLITAALIFDVWQQFCTSTFNLQVEMLVQSVLLLAFLYCFQNLFSFGVSYNLVPLSQRHLALSLKPALYLSLCSMGIGVFSDYFKHKFVWAIGV